MGIAIFFAPIIVPIIVSLYKNKQYKKGMYYQITKNSYPYLKHDKGKHGEYLIYEALRHFENDGGRFLFNALIPKGNNTNTEIDVILICSKGLFVLESKNFSGWVFGNETQSKWTQTLPLGRGRCQKEYFYNPIMQNASHIRYLKNIVGKNTIMQSIIVFSDRCVLKDITIKSNNVSVINRYNLASTVAQICELTQIDVYTETEINNIYNKLYPYTQLASNAYGK